MKLYVIIFLSSDRMHYLVLLQLDLGHINVKNPTGNFMRYIEETRQFRWRYFFGGPLRQNKLIIFFRIRTATINCYLLCKMYYFFFLNLYE